MGSWGVWKTETSSELQLELWNTSCKTNSSCHLIQMHCMLGGKEKINCPQTCSGSVKHICHSRHCYSASLNEMQHEKMPQKRTAPCLCHQSVWSERKQSYESLYMHQSHAQKKQNSTQPLWNDFLRRQYGCESQSLWPKVRNQEKPPPAHLLRA